jgi:hypothetical protein
MERKEMPDFIKGLELSRLFYHQAVAPLLREKFAHLTYSAARLDFGSDVLGFDTPTSRDHGWGPQLTIYLSTSDLPLYKQQISNALANGLPYEVGGYPTHFIKQEDDTNLMAAIQEGRINHLVVITTIKDFFMDYAGIDVNRPLRARDWLLIPQQRMRTITSGSVYHDGLARLEDIRAALKWYPREVWLYLMANAWRQLDQEEPFMGRCGDVGDNIGSRLVASRQVQRLMKLCFLMERQYAPYSKWFGSAFLQLDCAAKLSPIFERVFEAEDWQQRQEPLSEAYLILQGMHNQLGVTEFIQPDISPFYSRPYMVPHCGRFVDALLSAIQSDEVRTLPPYTGSIDQVVQSIDVLESIPLCQEARFLYGDGDDEI